MNNESKIISDLKEVFQKEKQKLDKKQSNQRLTSANEFYNNLIERGIIKKRGYTLRGIEDSHLFNCRLNGY